MTRIKNTLTMKLFLLLFSSWFLFLPLKAEEWKLRYTKPAQIWEEAIPLGNGRIGAMVFGSPQKEILQLNEETIWGGSPYRNDTPVNPQVLNEIRRLVFEGKTDEADRLANQTFFKGPHGMPFQTAGELEILFQHHDDYEHFHRELDLNSAIATTTYTVNNIQYQREYFSSFSENVLIVRLTAKKKRALSFTISYKNSMATAIFTEKEDLVLNGKGTDHEGIEGKVRYQVRTRVKQRGGNLFTDDNTIRVENASEAVLYIAIGTNSPIISR